MNGIKLCEDFYNDVVYDIVSPIYNEHGAGLIGSGSEVLGYDTQLSEDHDYYARCFIFTDGCDYKTSTNIRNAIENIPSEYKGYKTDVTICNARDFYKGATGFFTHATNVYEWLSIPSQTLLELTSGKIFKATETLESLRTFYKYYPDDLARYITAAQWTRIGQEMAFMGRCGEVGDEVGSILIATRLVGYIMRLCFLYEKKYPPYWKWYGTAFKKLKCAKKFELVLNSILSSSEWKEREKYLCEAYVILGETHNESNPTGYIKPEIVQYYTRPYMVVKADEYTTVLLNEIKDEEVKQLPPNIGGIDQISDQTDFLGHVERRTNLIKMWKNQNDFQW